MIRRCSSGGDTIGMLDGWCICSVSGACDCLPLSAARWLLRSPWRNALAHFSFVAVSTDPFGAIAANLRPSILASAASSMGSSGQGTNSIGSSVCLFTAGA